MAPKYLLRLPARLRKYLLLKQTGFVAADFG